MGVKGLTTYIAKNAEKYLNPFELHDCSLVIDGDNLASQLFNRTLHSAFGGNYDEYYQITINFFTLLRKCNVTPYVILDGGYEQKKMRTIKSRLQTRICAVKHALPLTRRIIIPIFMREVFVDAARASGAEVMRCFFEADDEIAILARKLNCPVLSYDSDFYIHNVAYIPYVTITHKIYKKTVEDEKNYEIQIIGKSNQKSKNAKNKAKKTVVVGKPGAEETPEKPKHEYCYIDCAIYTIENLIDGRCLQKEMIPLFATLLGNDYIERRTFQKFYSNVKAKKGQRKSSNQQRKIAMILGWLKHETLQSALSKIAAVMKEGQREELLKQIRAAMNGYNCEKSVAFEYFGFEEPQVEETADLPETLEVNLEDANETDDEEEEDDEEESEDEENDEKEEEVEEVLEEPDEDLPATSREPLPEWMKTRYLRADFPRFLVDLYSGHRYVNYPQIEDLSLHDSNTISYPILLKIYAILTHPEKHRLYYMTRVQKYARFYYKKFEEDEIPDVTFNPDKSRNLEEFRSLFEKFPNQREIFESIKEVPKCFQVYMLAIVFWMSRSRLTTSVHLQSVLLGVLVIYYVKRKFAVTHDEVNFFKNYAKLLEQIKQTSIESSEEKSFPALAKVLTKHEAILAMERLVTNFNASEKFQRRHADFNREIIHCFAELQSVCFFFHTFNSLCDHPFESLKMGHFFNGFFNYNVYVNLKSRSDPGSYIENHIFKAAPNLGQIFSKLLDWCRAALPRLEENDEKRIKTKPKKVVSAKQEAVNEARIKIAQNRIQNDCLIQSDQEASDTETDDFEDVNNKFAQLLKIK